MDQVRLSPNSMLEIASRCENQSSNLTKVWIEIKALSDSLSEAWTSEELKQMKEYIRSADSTINGVTESLLILSKQIRSIEEAISRTEQLIVEELKEN